MSTESTKGTNSVRPPQNSYEEKLEEYPIEQAVRPNTRIEIAAISALKTAAFICNAAVCTGAAGLVGVGGSLLTLSAVAAWPVLLSIGAPLCLAGWIVPPVGAIGLAIDLAPVIIGLGTVFAVGGLLALGYGPMADPILDVAEKMHENIVKFIKQLCFQNPDFAISKDTVSQLLKIDHSDVRVQGWMKEEFKKLTINELENVLHAIGESASDHLPIFQEATLEALSSLPAEDQISFFGKEDNKKMIHDIFLAKYEIKNKSVFSLENGQKHNKYLLHLYSKTISSTTRILFLEHLLQNEDLLKYNHDTECALNIFKISIDNFSQKEIDGMKSAENGPMKVIEAKANALLQEFEKFLSKESESFTDWFIEKYLTKLEGCIDPSGQSQSEPATPKHVLDLNKIKAVVIPKDSPEIAEFRLNLKINPRMALCKLSKDDRDNPLFLEALKDELSSQRREGSYTNSHNPSTYLSAFLKKLDGAHFKDDRGISVLAFFREPFLEEMSGYIEYYREDRYDENRLYSITREILFGPCGDLPKPGISNPNLPVGFCYQLINNQSSSYMEKHLFSQAVGILCCRMRDEKTPRIRFIQSPDINWERIKRALDSLNTISKKDKMNPGFEVCMSLAKEGTEWPNLKFEREKFREFIYGDSPQPPGEIA